MQFGDYQNLAKRTAGMFSDPNLALATWALGVAGEAGEVAELVKKHLGHGHGLDRDQVTKELGDVLWYCAVLADSQGINLDTVAQRNIDKLKARYPEGFSHERSIDRCEEG